MTTVADSPDFPLAQHTAGSDDETVAAEIDKGITDGTELVLPADQFLVNTATRLGESAMCFRCGMSCNQEAVDKYKFKAVCKGCHSVYTMLVRNMAWPPADFSSLPEEQQTKFWASCKETPKEHGKFVYSNIKALLIKQCTNRLVHSQHAEEWTEGKPLEGWRQLGYDTALIEKNARKVFNPTCGVLYEVPIQRSSRSVTLSEVEERITCAEQQLRQKRQRAAAPEDQLLESESELETADADQTANKKQRKAKGGMTDEEKKASKEAALAARKEAQALIKHNKEQVAIATRAMAALAKPVEEIKKAFHTLEKVADQCPPQLKSEVEDMHKEILEMSAQASSIIKRAGEAAAKSFQLEEFKWTIKVVMVRGSECKRLVKQFSQVMKALKLKP
jgi:hypothetical protein